MTNTQHVRVEGAATSAAGSTARRPDPRAPVGPGLPAAFAHSRGGTGRPSGGGRPVRGADRQFRPAYLEEMRGIADGAGLDLTDVLAINVRTEVMYSAKARHAPRAVPSAEAPPAECSAFACVPAPASPDR